MSTPPGDGNPWWLDDETASSVGMPSAATARTSQSRHRRLPRFLLLAFALLVVAGIALAFGRGLGSGVGVDPPPSSVSEPAGSPAAGEAQEADPAPGDDAQSSGAEPTPVETPTQDDPGPAAFPGDDVVLETPVPASALDVVGTLEIKGRAPTTGYDRTLFGQAWADVDRNGCDTRNDILRRDLVDLVLKSGTDGCMVLTGVLLDPYSGGRIDFERGAATSAAVQIDHVVALADAWQKGAQQWDAETRELFANDPLNLLAVDGPLNQQKGAGDAATWLPPDRSYWCAYVARIVAVKDRYAIWVTQAESERLASVLVACPDEPLPTDGL